MTACCGGDGDASCLEAGMMAATTDDSDGDNHEEANGDKDELDMLLLLLGQPASQCEPVRYSTSRVVYDKFGKSTTAIGRDDESAIAAYYLLRRWLRKCNTVLLHGLADLITGPR